jgi:rhodanese-related sulfurtransferase
MERPQPVGSTSRRSRESDYHDTADALAAREEPIMRSQIDSQIQPGLRRRIIALSAVLAIGVSVAFIRVAAPVANGQTDQTSVMRATLMEPDQKTAEVSTGELQQILAAGSAYVFDARPHLEYAISHIPGALNVAPKPGVPASLYVSDVAEIGRLVPGTDAAIVLYCNGPFCGKSKRLAEELLEADYTNVRRYQLGAPTWRALVGVMATEPDGARYVYEGDRTAVWFDARDAAAFAAGSIAGARNLEKPDVTKAKDDGRLPMDDHNTRIIVFGAEADQAREVAQEIAKNAFHNVSYFNGTLAELRAALR